MAKVEKVEFVDDFDGKSVEPDDRHEVSLTFMGESYRLDLRTKNLEKLEASLTPWINSGTRTGGRRRGVKPRGAVKKTALSTSSGATGSQTKAIREWAQANGYEVSTKGRIPQDVVAEFDKAHRKASK